jgi:hypothetical protein
MHIASRQLTRLADDAQRRFEAHVRAWLLAHHADAVLVGPEGPVRVGELPADTLAQAVAASVARGRARGLTWASNLTAYVVLRVLVAPDFDEAPRIAARLGGAAADVRFDEIVHGFTDADWDAVRAGARRPVARPAIPR